MNIGFHLLYGTRLVGVAVSASPPRRSSRVMKKHSFFLPPRRSSDIYFGPGRLEGAHQSGYTGTTSERENVQRIVRLLQCSDCNTLVWLSPAIGHLGTTLQESLSLIIDTEKSLLPKWFLLMTYGLTLLQLSAVAVVYLQPTNEVLEKALSDPKSDQFSVRNVLPRLISRTLSVVRNVLGAHCDCPKGRGEEA